MAIGAIPLIPLHPTQLNPDARFQRFGLNDSQLQGKPLVDLVTPETPPSPQPRTVTRSATRPTQPQEPPISKQGPGGNEPKASVSVAQEGPPSYTGKVGNPSGTGTLPKPGSYLNLKA
jgi:hypothetical protein